MPRKTSITNIFLLKTTPIARASITYTLATHDWVYFFMQKK